MAGTDAAPTGRIGFQRWTQDLIHGPGIPEFPWPSGVAIGDTGSQGLQPPDEARGLYGRLVDDTDSFSGNLLFLLGGLVSGVVAAVVLWVIPKGRSTLP